MNRRECNCNNKNNYNKSKNISESCGGTCLIYFLPKWLDNNQDCDISIIKDLYKEINYKDINIYFKILKKCKNKLLDNSKKDSKLRAENLKKIKINEEIMNSIETKKNEINSIKKLINNDKSYIYDQTREINQLKSKWIDIKAKSYFDINFNELKSKSTNYDLLQGLIDLYKKKIETLQYKIYNENILIENFEKFNKKESLNFEKYGNICINIINKILLYKNFEIEKLEINKILIYNKYDENKAKLENSYKNLWSKSNLLNLNNPNTKNKKLKKNKTLNQLFYNKIQKNLDFKKKLINY